MTLLAELAADEGDERRAREMLYEALRIRCALGDAPGICAALEKILGRRPRTRSGRATRILAAAAAHARADRRSAVAVRSGRDSISNWRGCRRYLGADVSADGWQQGRASASARRRAARRDARSLAGSA